MPITAVIFDMDGVIIDSESAHHKMEEKTVKHFGGDPSKIDWMSVKGVPLRFMFEKIIAEQGLEATWQVMQAYKVNLTLNTKASDFSIFPGFTDLVTYLEGKVKLALTTSAAPQTRAYFFEEFEIEKYFPIAVDASLIHNGKPHPEPYEKTIELLQEPADQCVVIEDSDNGVISAKAAGAQVIAVTHTLSADKLKEADYIVDSLAEVKEVLISKYGV